MAANCGGVPAGWLTPSSTGPRRRRIFEDAGDFLAFERGLPKPAGGPSAVRLCCSAAMPNHFHLVLWPTADRALSRFMQWLTLGPEQRLRPLGRPKATHPRTPCRLPAKNRPSDKIGLRRSDPFRPTPIRWKAYSPPASGFEANAIAS
jgi:hypothetical protein